MKSHIEGRELVLEDGQRFDLNGDLDLGKRTTPLPDNLKVDGTLDLGEKPTPVPENLTVGNISLERPSIILPNDLKASEPLIKEFNTVPDNLTVHGTLNLKAIASARLSNNFIKESKVSNEGEEFNNDMGM